MSDERKIYAGQLGVDQIGKRIRVKTATGAVIEDVLAAVIHEEGSTIVRFTFVTPTMTFDHGFRVDPEETAVVL